MADQGPQDPATEPVDQLFAALGDPYQFFMTFDQDLLNDRFAEALTTYALAVEDPARAPSDLEAYYLGIARSALADVAHVADHFVEKLAMAKAAFPWQDLPCLREGPDAAARGLWLPLEVQWRRFAEWAYQGRRDDLRDWAFGKARAPAYAPVRLFEDELGWFQHVPAARQRDTVCTACGRPDPRVACGGGCHINDAYVIVGKFFCGPDCAARDEQHSGAGAGCHDRLHVGRGVILAHSVVEMVLVATCPRPTSLVKADDPVPSVLRVYGHPFPRDRRPFATFLDSFADDNDHDDDDSSEDDVRQRIMADLRPLVGSLPVGKFPDGAVRFRPRATLSRGDQWYDQKYVCLIFDKLAAILYGESLEAIRLAMPLLKLWVFPFCQKIELLAVVPKNARTAVVWLGPEDPPPLPGQEQPAPRGVRNNMFRDHYVLRLTLRGGDVFAVDLACNQYAWSEILCPWDVYAALRVHIVRSCVPVDPATGLNDQGILDPRSDLLHGAPASTRAEVVRHMRSRVMTNVVSAVEPLYALPPLAPGVQQQPLGPDDFDEVELSMIVATIRTAHETKMVLKHDGVWRARFADPNPSLPASGAWGSHEAVSMTLSAGEARRFRGAWELGEEMVRDRKMDYRPMVRLWWRKADWHGPTLPRT